VEDVRLDFEDGYGDRGWVAEDDDARAAAARLADAAATGVAPPFCGLRCKSLEAATRRRAIATVDIFVGELAARGALPAGFVLTLPKVTSADQVRAMSLLCERLEEAHGLRPGQLSYEVQAETPQLILGSDGAATVARCVQAGGARLTGVHYGTYDYSASLAIAAEYQSMEHPAADHARAVLQVAVAGTGVRLSDGSSNVLPVGTRDEVAAAWRLHARLVRRSLERGFYQGWDLHPAQLASRYAATYGFFRAGLPRACARLASYAANAGDEATAADRADGMDGRDDAGAGSNGGGAGRTGKGRGHATAEGAARGGTAEEPATARALAGYLLRALDCGAADEDEVAARSGLARAGIAALARAGLGGSGGAGLAGHGDGPHA
jgi:citrate lyase beta subunit